jgi:hypothetical protein
MNKESWLVAVGAGRWQVPGIKGARMADGEGLGRLTPHPH